MLDKQGNRVKMRSGWEKYVDSLPYHVEGPPNKGWLSVKQFGDRADVTSVVVKEKMQQGKIPPEYIISVPFNPKMPQGRRRPMLDWNAAGYAFIAQHSGRRPDDFEFNDAGIYRPIELDADEQPTPVNYDLEDISKINDLGQAKLEHEKLKMLRERLAYQVELNSVIPIELVQSVVTEIATSVKAELLNAVGRMAPKLISVYNITEIRKILIDYTADAIVQLNRLMSAESYTDTPIENNDVEEEVPEQGN